MKRRIEGSVIAQIPFDVELGDLVTNPHNSVAYAALRSAVAVINSLHKVSCVIPVGGHPRALTVGADGSRLYATNYGGSVSVIDISDHRVGVIPGACCVQQIDTADGALIYAAGIGADGSRISVIEEGGASVAAVGGFDGQVITDLAADSGRQRLYVGLSRRSAYRQYDGGSIAVIDTTTNVATKTIDVVGSPDTITMSPDGSMMYATHYDHLCVSAIDLATLRVTPIVLGDSPLDVQLTPDGLRAYVTNRGSLSVVDTVANEAARIAVGDLPRCVRISPDGKYAYVSNSGGQSVSIIDTIAQGVADTIDVGGHPEALAVSPDGDRLYVGDYWSGALTVLSVRP